MSAAAALAPVAYYSILSHCFSASDGSFAQSDGVYCGGGIASSYLPAARNNPVFVNAVNHGPIPFGVWLLKELIPAGEETGPQTIVLAPADAATLTYVKSLGRGPFSFRIHGDSADGKASEGCIIAPEAFRVEILWASGIRRLIVLP